MVDVAKADITLLTVASFVVGKRVQDHWDQVSVAVVVRSSHLFLRVKRTRSLGVEQNLTHTYADCQQNACNLHQANDALALRQLIAIVRKQTNFVGLSCLARDSRAKL